MRFVVLLAFCFSALLAACLPAFLPTPAATVDIEATAGSLARETVRAQSTPALPATNTVIASPPTKTTTPTIIGTPATATETQNPILLTLTATLGTGTVAVSGTPPTILITSEAIGATATETLHARFFGTLPPNQPFGHVTLINKSKAEAYVSLQHQPSPGVSATILEYPVKKSVDTVAPAGNYIFVAWVGGRKMTGEFHLSKDEDLTITLFIDKVTIGH